MATPEDMKANAEFIRLADEVVDVPGGTNNNNYANITLICEIAERLMVDAVMPMWGHASENPLLPSSLLKLKHKVSFIGPPAGPMHALGDKIGSTIIAQSAGVPVIGWNGDSISIDYKKEGLTAETYAKANVLTAEDCLACSNRIGYPVMIKASEGGGGKGIRKCYEADGVLEAFRQVQGEIPGSPIFVMKMASNARHLEVQLIADKHGDAIALSGRDCSVQRRHQKIIEEGPPIAAPKDVFRRMENSAIALAKAVGYCNAGTVEFLFMEEDNSYAFLELNPRLQVEHPVTENILGGINLPASQLQVAMGIPLHRIGEIRKIYGRHKRGKDTIDYALTERQVPPRHCIAIRITAENPDAAFQPTSGNITELNFRSQIDVWGYFSIDKSGSIHEFADSQFGHIFASGPDRESARRACLIALKELTIRGDIRTTTEYIIKLLQSDDFMNNNIDTDWLDGRIANHAKLAIEEGRRFGHPAELIAVCGAALQGYQHFDQRDQEYILALKVGQVPSIDFLKPVVNIDLIFNNIKYSTVITQSNAGRVEVKCNGQSQMVLVRQQSCGGFLLNVAGKSHLAYPQEEPSGAIRMTLDGSTCIFTPEYDPTSLRSTVAGKLARQLVPDGSHLEKGMPYVEVEVMKMYMPLKTDEAGTVHFQISEGAALSPGDVIATMALDDPDRVVKAETFTGSLDIASDCSDDSTEDRHPHLKLRQAMAEIDDVLAGFPKSDLELDAALSSVLSLMRNPLTPYYSMEETMSVLRARLDATLVETIFSLNQEYFDKVSAGDAEVVYPSATILEAIAATGNKLTSAERLAFHTQVAPVSTAAEPYMYSADVRILAFFMKVIEDYLQVESLFDKLSFTDVVTQLRRSGMELEPILGMCRSFNNLKVKNVLLIKVIEEMKNFPLSTKNLPQKLSPGIYIRNEINIRQLKARLSDLTKLNQNVYSHVSFSTNLLLMEQYGLKPELRRARLDEAVVAALNSNEAIGGTDRISAMKKFVDSNIVIRDLLLDALSTDKDYRIAAMELYIRKIYRSSHNLHNFTCGNSLSSDAGYENSSWVRFEFVTKVVNPVGSNPEKTSDSLTESRLSYSDLVRLSSPEEAQSPERGPRDRGMSYSQSPGPADSVRGDRIGLFAVVDSFDQLPSLFANVLEKIPEGNPDGTYVNAIHIVLMRGLLGGSTYDDDCSALLGGFLASQKGSLKARRVRRVTFLVGQRNDNALAPGFASVFTFREKNDFGEDRLFRHIEAPHAFHLDLPSLSNFDLILETGVTTTSGNCHIYKATPLQGGGPSRYFARLVSFTSDVVNSDAETLFIEALDSMGLVVGQAEAKKTSRTAAAANHVFLNVVAPDNVVDPKTYEAELRRICNKYWYKMVRLSISKVEVKLTCSIVKDAPPMHIRLVASNPTGFVLKIDNYYETLDPTGESVFRSVSGFVKGPMDGTPTTMSYPVTELFAQQRAQAMVSSDTLYAYDWPMLFEASVLQEWESYTLARDAADLPPIAVDAEKEPFVCQELVLCDRKSGKPYEKGWEAQIAERDGVLVPNHNQVPGQNTCAMVAWLMILRTPEYPDGRQIVVICNDITMDAGSFGTKEDVMFFKASEYARDRGIPRLYLAANSGARIGMAQSLKKQFKVCWTDAKDPSKGFKYIYLEKDVYQAFTEKYAADSSKMPVLCTPVPDEPSQMMITDIIGEEPDLGVENLMGSGLIAGETARAYDEIFTLTLVIGRTVGIGAYLVRLGQRTIQRTRNSPIILTGHQALNKLMGRDIYTANDQLGGPMIMHPNGVSHMLAETHMDSVTHALKWLSYIPKIKGSSLPLRDMVGTDHIDRLVEWYPTRGASYDPRLLCTGTTSGDKWIGGFFDRDTFVETLAGWAKTVIVGRGRLGGIPMGVIITENRTAEALKPADPADATSQEKMVQQAGGVWFPDSAYKTAQALKDFNREGLPCIVMANWRGFSGGQRDMFDEVLKFGSMIVDALVAYKHPLFVYIPPFAELRGGAWVVVDHTINADVMEFYAAEDARGGVLEATGAASIKYRDRDIVATAHRLDHALVEMDARLAKAKASGKDTEVASIQKEITVREKMLFGVYQQVAVHFADLHDTPGRMKAKGVIRAEIKWEKSRNFFFWRLRRRLTEFDLARKLAADEAMACAQGFRRTVTANLQAWFETQGGSTAVWEDDKKMMLWLTEHSKSFSSFIDSEKSKLVARNVSGMVSTSSAEELSMIMKNLTTDDRAKILAALK
jgi:acetyl-CoA carboxylase/biotin carboxylase 1